MKRKTGACLLCGEDLIYYEKAKKMKCVFCNKEEESYASCRQGHYVCDQCHAKKGIDIIMEYCKNSLSKNPIHIMQEIMADSYIYMHGPEHHIMVGAALLTAYRNSGGELDLEEALEEMKKRGSEYPGGSCGFWGCCGAAVSGGMFMSIVNKTTPLSGESWGLVNKTTSENLRKIAAFGGPRCCKRNSFTSAKETAKLVEKELGISMEIPSGIKCKFSDENKECLGKKCPYYV